MDVPNETDYLVVGSGAMAMAFVDTLLDESDARVVMVDRRHRPGGHWNDAYPFVRLHQPSMFYGVGSRELGSGRKDDVGLNQGLYELASGAEVVDYFEQVMNQRFLPSGRVTFLPMCSHDTTPNGDHELTQLLSGETRTIRARRIVDATLSNTAIPSTHPPRYTVAPTVRCISPNELPRIKSAHPGYVVVGSGKTGIDACLWLLANGAAPQRIHWIMPRDAWFLDRANLQPGQEHLDRYFLSLAKQLECINAAGSLPELFRLLEEEGQLLRLDPTVRPSTFRCATVSREELEQLRRIESIVRLGRVDSIAPTRISLERGHVDAEPDWLYIDCSAAGLPPKPSVSVFEASTISLTNIGWCQPSLSAAVTAYVECHIHDDDERNALCRVIPYPEVPTDWLKQWAGVLANRRRWSSDEGLARWLSQTRLDTRRQMRAAKPEETAKQAAIARYHAVLKTGIPNLRNLLAAID